MPPLEDVRRGLAEPVPAPATTTTTGPTPGTGKTVTVETIALLMQAEPTRIVYARGWEQAVAGFAQAHKDERGSGGTAIAQGL